MDSQATTTQMDIQQEKQVIGSSGSLGFNQVLEVLLSSMLRSFHHDDDLCSTDKNLSGILPLFSNNAINVLNLRRLLSRYCKEGKADLSPSESAEWMLIIACVDMLFKEQSLSVIKSIRQLAEQKVWFVPALERVQEVEEGTSNKAQASKQVTKNCIARLIKPDEMGLTYQNAFSLAEKMISSWQRIFSGKPKKEVFFDWRFTSRYGPELTSHPENQVQASDLLAPLMSFSDDTFQQYLSKYSGCIPEPLTASQMIAKVSQVGGESKAYSLFAKYLSPEISSRAATTAAAMAHIQQACHYEGLVSIRKIGLYMADAGAPCTPLNAKEDFEKTLGESRQLKYRTTDIAKQLAIDDEITLAKEQMMLIQANEEYNSSAEKQQELEQILKDFECDVNRPQGLVYAVFSRLSV